MIKQYGMQDTLVDKIVEEVKSERIHYPGGYVQLKLYVEHPHAKPCKHEINSKLQPYNIHIDDYIVFEENMYLNFEEYCIASSVMCCCCPCVFIPMLCVRQVRGPRYVYMIYVKQGHIRLAPTE